MRATGRTTANDFTELARAVGDSGLMRRRYGYYWTRLIAAPLAIGVALAAFVLIGDTWWQLFTAAALAVIFTQVAMLGHDAAHRQIFRSGRWNDWVTLIIGNLLVGMSYGWWQHKHTRHHANPNKIGVDPDIDLPVISVTPAQADRRAGWRGPLGWVMAHQGVFFFPILLLEGLSLHASSVRRVFSPEPLRRRPVEISLLTIRLAGYLTLVFLILSPGVAFAFLGVQLGIFGFYMGMAFAPNHKGMPLVPKDVKLDFLRRQVLMSRNIAGQSRARHRHGRAQLPDRAPPVPIDAAAPSSRRIADDRGVLPCPRRDLYADGTVGFVPDRRPLHQPGRAGRARPVRVPAARGAPGGLTRIVRGAAAPARADSRRSRREYARPCGRT